MKTLTIKYDTSVFTPAGWRLVTITAYAEKTSEKMAQVDDEKPKRTSSITGANRQKYKGTGFCLGVEKDHRAM